MNRTKPLSLSHRIAVGAIGLVLLLLAGMAGVLLHEGPWNWWIASFGLLAFLEGLDFVVAAVRERGGWPSPAYFLLDLVIPG